MLQEDLLDRQVAGEAGIPLRLANAEVVTAEARFRGAVTVEDGVIVAVEEGGRVPAGALDCRGELLLPGLADLHTDHCERPPVPSPGVPWDPPPAALPPHPPRPAPRHPPYLASLLLRTACSP